MTAYGATDATSHYHPIISSFMKTQIDVTFLVLLAYTGCPGTAAIKQVSVPSGKGLGRESSCPGIILSGKPLSGKVVVWETSVTNLFIFEFCKNGISITFKCHW